MGLDVELRADACVGSGNCSFWAPYVFGRDEEGVVSLRADAPPVDKLVLAANDCPTKAIVICRDGEQLAP